MTTTATVLAGLIAVGLITVNVRAFWAPQAAAGFGIPDTPTDDPTFRAWLAVKAVRDLASGLFILVLIMTEQHQALGWFLLVATVIPIGDAVIVLRNNGPKAAVYGVHAPPAVVMPALGLLMLAA